MNPPTPQTIADAARVSALCTKLPRTKGQLERATGWSPSRVQRALDHCKAEYLVARDPFYFAIENGRYTYGYRNTVAMLKDNLMFEIGYVRTRINTNSKRLNHALRGKATLSAAMNPAQRRQLTANKSQFDGMLAQLDVMITQVRALI